MSIKYVMLGFLSETSQTGYDLKKKFSDSDIFHWSGNNNQIYRSLVELHQESLVTIEVRYQESKPPRKVYTITDAGQAALQRWVLSLPELPQFRNALLVQLNWADQVPREALLKMLAAYEEQVEVHLLMLREHGRRKRELATMHPAPFSFKESIAEHWKSFYALELDWVHALREELGEQ